MNENKVVRSVCLFKKNPDMDSLVRLGQLSDYLKQAGFVVQTQRLCSDNVSQVPKLDNESEGEVYLSVGKVKLGDVDDWIDKFSDTKNISFNVDLTEEVIDERAVRPLMRIVNEMPSKSFNNVFSSPFFPSAKYQRDGFSIGLQQTDLSEGCSSISEWLGKVRTVWAELGKVLNKKDDFLGIDTAIAPLFEGKSSFVDFIGKIGIDFGESVTTDMYVKITNFLKQKCDVSIGLCGLMLPCLEDFGLAREYEKGNFSIERNLFLSLHSGLGIDTYPIGIDEDPERVVEILRLVKGLSNKFGKPLSVRFVSDGKAKIGDETDFQNQYLKDVMVRKL